MKWTHISLLLLAILACANVKGQNEDDLEIPIESDNQFPPDNHSENDGDLIEGSGTGVVEDPIVQTTTELSAAPKLEEIETTAVIDKEVIGSADNESSCPIQCVCNTEGDTGDFVVDCSGYGLTEFPTPINPKTTKLNLQKNKLTEIPKDVSQLKNLRELNANDNLIMELASGSVSELPELVILKLANNRLIEYPKDLKNSLSLTKLQELDLGGNDMRTALAADIFSGFSDLRKITLATSTKELIEDLCKNLKDTLENVCTGSCDKESSECPDAPQDFDKELIQATLPGMTASDISVEKDKENTDPTIDIPTNTNSEKKKTVDDISPITPITSTAETTTVIAGTVNEFSLRAAVNSAPIETGPSNAVVNTKQEQPTSTEGDVKIGAKTADTKSGGVDRSLIAIIVAGMVVVVAGITIKKNWSSIKQRFSSTARTPNEQQRTAGNANGTSPEEVPLQDKTPV